MAVGEKQNRHNGDEYGLSRTFQRRNMKMAKLIYHADDGREFHIATEDFIYLKTREGAERNWEWQYITTIHGEINKIFEQAEGMYDRINNLLPKDIPMGELK
jgi:hypothetical protein